MMISGNYLAKAQAVRKAGSVDRGVGRELGIRVGRGVDSGVCRVAGRGVASGRQQEVA